ncbi:MAG: hypothetical protein HY042_04765, partial [Spirochaetia bacterium]|nr:hypothetical protein [Spirochaetia bacterium]
MKRLYQISRFGGALAVIAFPLSVSLSQFGLLTAVVSWVFLRVGVAYLHRSAPENGAVRSQPDPFMPFPRVPVLLMAVLIYLVFLLSLFVNAALSDSFLKVIRRGMSEEMRHTDLILAAFWVYAYASGEKQKQDVLRWIKIAAAVTIGAGIVSIFSIYRLGKIPYHMMHGWEAGADARFQHYMATVSVGHFNVHLYLPIGFMNTHLTYAAHLCMLLPLFLFRTMRQAAFFEKSPLAPEARRDVISVIYNIGIVFACGVILILNNGRSAMVGLAAAVVLGLYYY